MLFTSTLSTLRTSPPKAIESYLKLTDCWRGRQRQERQLFYNKIKNLFICWFTITVSCIGFVLKNKCYATAEL